MNFLQIMVENKYLVTDKQARFLALTRPVTSSLRGTSVLHSLPILMAPV